MDDQLEIQELPLYVQQGIKESIEQANRGEFISFDDVKKEAEALLKSKKPKPQLSKENKPE